MAFALVLAAGCGILAPSDPDEDRRERVVAVARSLIEAIELPPGYAALPRDGTWQHAQVQGGATRWFRPLAPTTSARALADFDRWFRARGYVPAVYARLTGQCTPALVTAHWARTDQVVRLVYRSEPGHESSLTIPFGHQRIPGRASADVEAPAPLPVCP